MRNKILAILIIVLLLGLTFLFQKQVKNFFYSVSSPFQKNLWRLGRGVMIEEEKGALRQRIQELLSENISLKELKAENEFLRKALNLGLADDFEMKMAEVIGKDVSNDSLIINQGKKQGIITGSSVIISEKVLVGRIGEVLDDFSKVVLTTSKESSFDAKVSEKDIHGLVKGNGNLGLELGLVLKEKEVEEGDFVVTGALGSIFPQGLLVGQVKEVSKSDLEPFQKIEIEPAFKISDLYNVFIITNF